MNREIKFRAWAENMGMKYELDVQDDTDILNPSKELEKDGWILMQFTGLLDKNGKEIYEGDLIKVGENIYQICWYAMEGRLMPFTTTHLQEENYIASAGVPIRKWNWLDGGESLNFHDVGHYEVEVIGNIYENKNHDQPRKKRV